MSELAQLPEDVWEASFPLVEGIIRDYIDTGCKTAAAGTGTVTETDQARQSAIYQIRHLHLAEPNLPTHAILSGLLLAGWTPPPTADPKENP
jgi:hypothetical protein